MASSAEKVAKLIDTPDIETFGSSKYRKIRVRSLAGRLVEAKVVSRLNLPTAAAWDILTHPENYKIFRAIAVCFLCLRAACKREAMRVPSRAPCLVSPEFSGRTRNRSA